MHLTNKFDSFDVSIIIKTVFLTVSATIEPHDSLLAVRLNCLISFGKEKIQ